MVCGALATGLVDAVVEAPRGAGFTSCEPDYPRDEAAQKVYAASAQEPGGWDAFRATYLTETVTGGA